MPINEVRAKVANQQDVLKSMNLMLHSMLIALEHMAVHSGAATSPEHYRTLFAGFMTEAKIELAKMEAAAKVKSTDGNT